MIKVQKQNNNLYFQKINNIVIVPIQIIKVQTAVDMVSLIL